MYLSPSQIQNSLTYLEEIHPFFGMSFLAFKRAEIPIGNSEDFIFTSLANNILEQHYRPSLQYDGYYNPFITSDKSDRWLKPRYGSTSLQRITTDTFKDALIHVKKTSKWGWRPDYVERLRDHLGTERIPAFDLAVWLYRTHEWPSGISPEGVRDYFFDDYAISTEEQNGLFDLSCDTVVANWLAESPIDEDELLLILGTPPGVRPPEGAALSLLEFRHVGPTKLLRYEPAERLNIITGDNSLGKTFILECLWWVLTGEWFDKPVFPQRDKNGLSKINFALNTPQGRVQSFSTTYDWDTQTWKHPVNRKAVPGLVIYARYDGSFAVWDPIRFSQLESRTNRSTSSLFFTRENIWDGLQRKDDFGKTEWLCNGLITDWVKWQTGGEHYQEYFDSLIACLRELSPTGVEMLVPGPPTRLPRDTREFPTLTMPYGEVPVTVASAGVQRIIGLAYILVWTWHEHLANSRLVRRAPQRRLILIVDEIEAHLHPRWQRLIVPALIQVIGRLSRSVTPQIHLATHSPLVLASSEPVFNEGLDDLHHLRLADRDVALEELTFVKRGNVDLWLMSDVFGLDQARSLPAERAIEEAKALQLSKEPSPLAVRELNERLTKVLAPDDEFWVRWRFFAKTRGLDQ